MSTCGCAPAQPTLDNEDFRYFRFAFSNIDDSWEPDKQRARRTFEACVALSRQYRLLTEYTLVCEHWLARTFKRDYARLDELVPAAHWGGLPWPPRHGMRHRFHIQTERRAQNRTSSAGTPVATSRA